MSTMPSAALINDPPPKKVSWLKQAYQRATWVTVRYGKMVRPQMDQSSNLSLTNDQVLQRRDESIGHSFARPLNKRADIGAESRVKR